MTFVRRLSQPGPRLPRLASHAQALATCNKCFSPPGVCSCLLTIEDSRLSLILNRNLPVRFRRLRASWLHRSQDHGHLRLFKVSYSNVVPDYSNQHDTGVAFGANDHPLLPLSADEALSRAPRQTSHQRPHRQRGLLHVRRSRPKPTCSTTASTPTSTSSSAPAPSITTSFPIPPTPAIAAITAS